MIKTLSLTALLLTGAVAQAAPTCIYIPRPCPPVGSYNQQIAILRMQSVSEATIKKYEDAARQMVRGVPGTNASEALNSEIQSGGDGCEEIPARLEGDHVPLPYPVATPADVLRYPRCE